MPLIKNNRAEHLSDSAIVLNLGDLSQEAKRIIAEARAEADRIVAEATEKADAMIAGASDRGFNIGKETGLTEGREQGREEAHREAMEEFSEQFQSVTDSWTEALSGWESDRNAMLLAAREDVLTFAVTMAKKVVVRLTRLDGRIIQDQLAETLSLLSRQSSLRIVINPEDRPIVEEIMPALLEHLAHCEHAEIENDASVTRGGCIVRTCDGLIDATIEKQIDRIIETFLPAERKHADAEDDVGADR